MVGSSDNAAISSNMRRFKNFFLDNRYVILTTISLTVLICAITGIILLHGSNNRDNEYAEAQKYPFLSETLFHKKSTDLIINFTQLREVMNQHYNDAKVPVGVYFEYLPTGASVGVNDKLEVEIGSLAKVPAVMAIYEQIENGSLMSDDKVTVQENNLDSFFGDLWKKGAGTVLTVDEAVQLTLKKSDNTAASTLTSSLPKGALEGVFSQLDLPKTKTGPFPVMSPKSYASVFRNLYLSTFLSAESSNKILEMLSETDFIDKIPSGVSGTVKVSHKIGVFKIEGSPNIYSDCGIVYVPNRPYVLCIMVAADEEVARNEMNAYSKMIYSYVSQINSPKNKGIHSGKGD